MRRAFTLIEILVSITVILILISLLFPVLTGAKDKAKSTVCISNLRQIYTALKLYQSDWGEYPPNSVAWDGFKPYYPVVLHCPMSTKRYAEHDYTLVAGPYVEQGDPMQAAFDACRTARGPMLPLALDHNHWAQERPGEARLLLVRENGSIHSIHLGLTPKEPCISRFDFLNF